LRKLALFSVACTFFLFASFAFAQQADAAFGFGTLTSSGTTTCGIATCIIPEKGGLYTNVSGDVVFPKRVGFNVEAAWRTSQGNYPAQGPYRPILVDFNALYQPKLSKKVGLDLLAGIGLETTRFYGFQPTFSCTQLSACYTSSHHFLVDIGGGIRYYVWGHVFVRPEARFYHINNNTADFTSNNVLRVGASIGYTIGPD